MIQGWCSCIFLFMPVCICCIIDKHSINGHSYCPEATMMLYPDLNKGLRQISSLQYVVNLLCSVPLQFFFFFSQLFRRCSNDSGGSCAPHNQRKWEDLGRTWTFVLQPLVWIILVSSDAWLWETTYSVLDVSPTSTGNKCVHNSAPYLKFFTPGYRYLLAARYSQNKVVAFVSGKAIENTWNVPNRKYYIRYSFERVGINIRSVVKHQARPP